MVTDDLLNISELRYKNSPYSNPHFQKIKTKQLDKSIALSEVRNEERTKYLREKLRTPEPNTG